VPPSFPLGVSFFTFTQIAYLVDIYKSDQLRHKLLDFSLLITFFPHLAAGPILHHKEMMPQFARFHKRFISTRNISIGLSIFIVGLSKKVLLADSLGEYADLIFDNKIDSHDLDFISAWSGALAYSFQLYFDFSGYSDMAIGIARMVGIHVPINFFSPYKSASIIEFWRRWHISLSRFLRMYLYIPLGGSKLGPTRHIINLFLTMLLGGIWHGAGWTFILWGSMHGVFLIINHLWQKFRTKYVAEILPRAKTLAWLLTFCVVVVAWVVFRAETVGDSMNIIKGMFGLNGFYLQVGWVERFESLRQLCDFLGLSTRDISSTHGGLKHVGLILVSLTICLIFPTTQQIFDGYQCGINSEQLKPQKSLISVSIKWPPNIFWSLLMSALLLICLSRNNTNSEFLYWQF